MTQHTRGTAPHWRPLMGAFVDGIGEVRVTVRTTTPCSPYADERLHEVSVSGLYMGTVTTHVPGGDWGLPDVLWAAGVDATRATITRLGDDTWCVRPGPSPRRMFVLSETGVVLDEYGRPNRPEVGSTVDDCAYFAPPVEVDDGLVFGPPFRRPTYVTGTDGVGRVVVPGGSPGIQTADHGVRERLCVVAGNVKFQAFLDELRRDLAGWDDAAREFSARFARTGDEGDLVAGDRCRQLAALIRTGFAPDFLDWADDVDGDVGGDWFAEQVATTHVWPGLSWVRECCAEVAA